MKDFYTVGILATIAFFSLLAYLFFVLGGKTLAQVKKKESFSSFNRCRAQGFSKEFCLETPVGAVGPNVCTCSNGMVGKYVPGFRGHCVC